MTQGELTCCTKNWELREVSKLNEEIPSFFYTLFWGMQPPGKRLDKKHEGFKKKGSEYTLRCALMVMSHSCTQSFPLL